MTLRAARWSRVSSAQQATDSRNGLPAQTEEQDRGIAILGATDTGISWSVTESGATVHETPAFQDMLAQAGKTFDVLIVAYVSRLGRNTIEGLRAAELIQAAGARVYFAQEGINTRDERQWPAFAAAVVAADVGRRQLRITMRGAYESRWRRRRIQAARAPFGYNPDWSINPTAAATVRNIYAEYATGNVSIASLATKYNLQPDGVKEMLKSRTYLGEAGHHVHDPEDPDQLRYRRRQEWIDGKQDAIVDQDLFDAVAEARARRSRAGGPPTHRPSMLQGILWCACGTKIRLDGTSSAGPQLRHRGPCSTWGPTERHKASTIEEPLKAAMRDMALSEETLARVIEPYLNRETPRRNDAPAVYPRQQRRLISDAMTDEHISVEEAQALLDDLRAREEAAAAISAEQEPLFSPDDIRQFYTHVRDVMDRLSGSDSPPPSFPEKLIRFRDEHSRQAFEAQITQDRHAVDQLWADLAHELFARIVYAGAGELRYEPTSAARRRLVPATLPARVTIGAMARPEGFEPPTC